MKNSFTFFEDYKSVQNVLCEKAKYKMVYFMIRIRETKIEERGREVERERETGKEINPNVKSCYIWISSL